MHGTQLTLSNGENLVPALLSDVLAESTQQVTSGLLPLPLILILSGENWSGW